MTIDPSAIPNFGAPQPPQGPPPIVKPDNALVANLLDQIDLKYATDAEGDLVAAWSTFRVFMMFRGEQQELFAVRAFYEREYPVEKKSELLDVLDEWNRDTLWPKVYTHTNEEGVVRVIGESQMVIPGGVNIDYFVSTTVGWLQASVGFNTWLADRLGLEAEVDSVDTIDSSLLNDGPPVAEGDKADDQNDGEDSGESDESDGDKPKD